MIERQTDRRGMTDIEPQPIPDPGTTAYADYLLELYPLYVAYSEATIDWDIGSVPCSHEEEQELRAALAPVSFNEFPALLELLGEDRAAYEKFWRMGHESMLAPNADELPPSVKKFMQIIEDSVKSAGATKIPRRKRHERRDNSDRKNDENGHQR
jgi:hypothetical protein